MLKKVEIKKLLSDLVRSEVEAIKDRVYPSALVEKILARAEELCQGVNLVQGIVELMLEEEINRRARALPNPASQIDLFAKQQAEGQLIRYEDGRVSRMGLATYPEIDARREDQIKHWRAAGRAFEREEQVRELVMPLMKADLTLTFETACRKLGLF